MKFLLSILVLFMFVPMAQGQSRYQQAIVERNLQRMQHHEQLRNSRKRIVMHRTYRRQPVIIVSRRQSVAVVIRERNVRYTAYNRPVRRRSRYSFGSRR